MKKALFLLVALTLVGATAFAQVRIGVGYANSTDRFKVQNSDVQSASANGVYGTVGFNIPIVGDLSLSPSVMYTFLSAQSGKSGLGGLVSAGATTQEHYITVPLHFEYGSELAPGFRLFFFGGPSVAFGLISKTTYSAGIGGYSMDTVLDNYNDYSNYGRWDVMLGGGMGFDLINRLRLTVGYDFGMLDRNLDSGTITRHRNQLSAGLAFLF